MVLCSNLMYLACWSHVEVFAVQGDIIVTNGVTDVVMEGFTVHIYIM